MIEEFFGIILVSKVFWSRRLLER